MYKKWTTAIENRDVDSLIGCLADDFVFVRHQSGTRMNKSQMSEMLQGFMASDQVVVEEGRCLYENSEVFVEHSVVSFADGSREAILTFMRLRDGLIVHMETGATPVQP
jgi:ketosteroid isomerase-like protein